jgi:hypothetical protein
MSRLLFALVGLFVAAPAAWACTCGGTFSGQPACVLRWTSPAVFVGEVTAIDPPPARPGGLISSSDPNRVHIKVSEAFAGVSSQDIVVSTPRSSASCGYDFKVGQVYLVYVTGGSAGPSVYSCGGTKPIDQAEEDLGYLRTVPATPPREGRLIGMAVRSDDDPSGRWRPIPGVRIFVEGQGLQRSATTDREGKYDVGVPAGAYHVWGDAGGGLFAETDTGEVTISETRGCQIADFAVVYDGHVVTRAVMPSGEVVPHLALDLIPDEPGAYPVAEARTDATGRIDIGRVPPGRYVLGFGSDAWQPFDGGPPAVFFPGTRDRSQARVITVKASERVTLDAFVLPMDLRVVMLTGVVRELSGRVVVGASVRVTNEDSELSDVGLPVHTDASGAFAIAVLAGRKYVVTVQPTRPGDGIFRTEVRGVVAAANWMPMTILVTRRGG